MHRQRIIDGIEKVFEGYAKDEELREALGASHFRIQLFPEFKGHPHFLAENGKIYDSPTRDDCISSPQYAAGEYFEALTFQYIHSHALTEEELTLTKAKAILNKDLGARVEKLKRDYARSFDNECDKQAESRYAQHPEV